MRVLRFFEGLHGGSRGECRACRRKTARESMESGRPAGSLRPDSASIETTAKA